MQDTQGDRHEVGVVFWVSAAVALAFILWGVIAPGNDAYAIAASEKTSSEFGVEPISDLKGLVEERHEEATLCLNNDDDFLTRFDGRYLAYMMMGTTRCEMKRCGWNGWVAGHLCPWS